MASDQYMRLVNWTPRLSDEEILQLLQRIAQGKVEQTKACPDSWVLAQERSQISAAFWGAEVAQARPSDVPEDPSANTDVDQSRQLNRGVAVFLFCIRTDAFWGTHRQQR